MDRPENVKIQYNQVLQLIDAFKTQQNDQLDDDKLFYDNLSKCRCCFMQLTEIRAPNIIHQWHRETFKAMTGFELSFGRNHSNYLCLNCIELLRISCEMKVAADGIRKVQKQHRQLFEIVSMKQESAHGIIITDFDFIEPKFKPDTCDETLIIIDDDDDDDDVETLQPDLNSTLLPDNDHTEIADMPATAFNPQIHEFENKEFYSAEKGDIIAATFPTSLSPSAVVHDDQSKKVNQFSCDFCEYETEVKGLLAYHMVSRHKKEDDQPNKELLCPMDGCNKICKNNENFYSHLYLCHDDSQEVSTCYQCGKVYKNKVALRQHQKIHIREFVCKICNKSFAQKYYLIDHMETYHIRNSKFNCTQCSKILKSQRKLKTHQRNNHDGKKFKCDKCDAAFNTRCHLRDHVKVKHEGKRFFCPRSSCSKTFTKKGVVATHLRKFHVVNDDEYKHYCKLIKIS